jgi:hypothetical protein
MEIPRACLDGIVHRGSAEIAEEMRSESLCEHLRL